MYTVALFARLEAKAGKENEVAKFLETGLALANQEVTTPIWFALRLGPTTFGAKDWSIACPWYARRRAMDAGREDIQWGIFVIPEVVVTKGHHVRVVRSDITRVTVSTHVCSLNLCDVNRRKIVHRWLASAHRVQVFK